MGDRAATETLAKVFLELMKDRSISQAELARRTGVEVRAVRRCLVDMQSAGMPLERDEDHPHVYWSVPKGWVPGGAIMSADDLVETVRIVSRATQSPTRDRLLQRLIARAGSSNVLAGLERMVSPELDEREDAMLRVAEDALAQGHVLRMRWYSSSRGEIEDRSVSVLRIVYANPLKLVAVCHRDDVLKWFRVDNIVAAQLDPREPPRERDEDDVEAFLSDTRFGYHQRGDRTLCAFVVRDPEHRWVGRQLGPVRTKTPVSGGMRFELETASVLPLARFLVSLGDAVRIETPMLAAEVRSLACAALHALPPEST